MNATEFTHDSTLNSFLCDYLDGKMDKAERASFEEYLENNPPEKNFSRKARKGKQALEVLCNYYQSDSPRRECLQK